MPIRTLTTANSYEEHRHVDTLFVDQWHPENRGDFALSEDTDASARDAWDITRGNRSIVVCAMDDGLSVDHINFSHPSKLVVPQDFGQDDTDLSPVRNDRGSTVGSHGTARAGVAATDENGVGVVGIAPSCSLIPVRTNGTINNDTIKALFDHLRLNGGYVINYSWAARSAPFIFVLQS